MTALDLAAAILVAAIRPGAALIAAPVFGHAHVPPPLRAAMAVAIGWAGVGVTTMPPLAQLPFAIIAEVVAGASIGFAAQAAFAAATMAGEVIAALMGLGFATTHDPAGGTMPVIASMTGLTTTMLFLAGQAHLTLIAGVVHSFALMPIGAGLALADMTAFGRLLFSSALGVALPAGFAIAMMQIVTAIIARAAPALNLFAVGLPLVQLAGAVALYFAWPGIAGAIASAIAASAVIG